MRNAWKLFCSDMRRLFSNTVTGIIVLGLVFLPSIFSWYNILACWDVFGNTGNLKVAVANTDEGYESDLVAIRVNIGENVVSALRANDQLDWVITDEDDAVDGAMSGKYYAAVVIPPTFSADMLTFYTADVERAKIVYYTNEKRSAIAPKVTDQGADRVAYQVNETFTETLASISMSVLSSLSDYLDEADADSRIGSLANHLQSMGDRLGQASSVVRSYVGVVDSAHSLIDGSMKLVDQTSESISEVSEQASQGKQSASTIAEALGAASGALSSAVSQAASKYEVLPGQIDAAYSSADALSRDSAAALRAQLPFITDTINALNSVDSSLAALEGIVPASEKQRLASARQSVQSALKLQESLRDKISTAADDIERNNADAQATHLETVELANQAKLAMQSLADDYSGKIKPMLDDLNAEITTLVGSLESSASALGGAKEKLEGVGGSVSDDLSRTTSTLTTIADKLDASSGELRDLGGAITKALAENDTEMLRELVASGTDALAAALAAPVELERTAIFPADNFGSQMAPLYTMLALWIGSLLLSVAIRVVVPEEDREKLDNPSHSSMFLGHFGVFAFISLLQSTCLAVGNMAFLGLQANNPLLYLICFWVSGLVFAFIIYSLVSSFANLGKAIAVLLLIIQVSGCNGSFPLQLLPDFIQTLSQWLPGTYVISAMRAAMFGVYANDFWISIGILCLFVVPFAILGLVLAKPLSKFMTWYIERVESSKLMA